MAFNFSLKNENKYECSISSIQFLLQSQKNTILRGRTVISWQLLQYNHRMVRNTLWDMDDLLDKAFEDISGDKEFCRESSVYGKWGCIHVSSWESSRKFEYTWPSLFVHCIPFLFRACIWETPVGFNFTIRLDASPWLRWLLFLRTFHTLVSQYSSLGSFQHCIFLVWRHGRFLTTLVSQGWQSSEHLFGQGCPTGQERWQSSLHRCLRCSLSYAWQICRQICPHGMLVEHLTEQPPSGGKLNGVLAWKSQRV